MNKLLSKQVGSECVFLCVHANCGGVVAHVRLQANE